MCYRASMIAKTVELEERYNVKRNQQFEISDTDFTAYHLNGFTHPEMLMIPQQSPNELHPSIWGIMPKGEQGANQNEYYKKAARWGGGLNARSEEVFNHFIYKHSIFEKRCIVPLTGFFEPHDHKGKKIPFYFSDLNGDILSVAGIYSITKDGTVTMTLLTKEASSLFAKIHNSKKRQIVLLDKQLEKEWVREDLNEKLIQELIDVKYDDSTLSTYPVAKSLFSSKVESNNEEALLPVNYPELRFVENTLFD